MKATVGMEVTSLRSTYLSPVEFRYIGKIIKVDSKSITVRFSEVVKKAVNRNIVLEKHKIRKTVKYDFMGIIDGSEFYLTEEFQYGAIAIR